MSKYSHLNIGSLPPSLSLFLTLSVSFAIQVSNIMGKIKRCEVLWIMMTAPIIIIIVIIIANNRC